MSLADIIEQLDAAAQKKLSRKLPSWAGAGVRVPASINLEQCSSESTALYKAGLVEPGARVADLTGGLGADSWAFAQRSSAVWYNEKDAVLLETVRANFGLLGLRNVAFNGFEISPGGGAWQDALTAFGPDVIYLDPARRNASGNKVFLLEDCSPDVTALLPFLLETAGLVIVKVSPMADITMLRRRLEGCLESVHVVGAAGECKELLCLCRKDASWTGTVLAADGQVWDPSGAVEPGELLFVPGAAMIKAAQGPVQGAILLDSRTLYCKAAYSARMACFGSFYRILEDLPFCSEILRSLRFKYPQADLTARALPLSSEELRKKTRTKPGGPVHVFACPVLGQRRVLVCQKVTLPEQVV